ncbi:MAG: transcriptional regulator [Chitinophagaceae bacterium]|nr:transcriptional regulator [Chitinophagaceae bacterium]
MKLTEAKEQFTQLWGALGSGWGINRTMAQVHALLLISEESLSTEDIMTQLSISRGNANMNLRELMNWNLVYKDIKAGERKEFFKAEKDIWEVAKRIARERKRREIQPLIASLNVLTDVDESNKEAKSFIQTVNNIHQVVTKMDAAVDTLIKVEENKFFGTIVKMFK